MMRASHSKAEPLRLKLVARPLLTSELILCIFLVVLALFHLHGRDLKCICNDSSVSSSAGAAGASLVAVRRTLPSLPGLVAMP